MEDHVSSDDDYYYEDVEDDSGDENCFQEIDDAVSSLVIIDKVSSAKVITKETLLAAQKEDLNRIMDMLSVGEHQARTLLIHFRWDAEKIFELYVESGIDKLYAVAGVKVTQNHNSFDIASSLTCEICVDDKPGNQFTAMDCGHYFCNECWTEYFTVKINEGESRRIRCMAHKCNSICDDSKVKTLVDAKDSKLAEKFHRFLMESYVEDNDRVNWCPSVPHCGNAIRVEDNKLCEIECSCGLQFCFSCSSEAHSPCSCIMWKLWLEKCQEESKVFYWITSNTTRCPKCRNFVEKNGGCNHVKCLCGQHFCYVCGAATGVLHTRLSITYHTCSGYKDIEVVEAKDSKNDIHRYLHYYNRYKAHTDSYKLEAKLKENIDKKLKALEEKESKLKDYMFVTDGLNMHFRSRRILSYSYVFAYYMFGDDLFKNELTEDVKRMNLQSLFEDQQQQFEAHVERLSKCLEEPFNEYDEDEVRKVRLQMVTLSNVVDKLCTNMYNCIENDLLGSLQHSIYCIAPVSAKGVEKAVAM